MVGGTGSEGYTTYADRSSTYRPRATYIVSVPRPRLGFCPSSICTRWPERKAGRRNFSNTSRPIISQYLFIVAKITPNFTDADTKSAPKTCFFVRGLLYWLPKNPPTGLENQRGTRVRRQMTAFKGKMDGKTFHARAPRYPADSIRRNWNEATVSKRPSSVETLSTIIHRPSAKAEYLPISVPVLKMNYNGTLLV